MKQKKIIAGFAVCIILLLSACATKRFYEGPELPDEKIAILKAYGLKRDYVLGANDFTITSIDGQSVDWKGYTARFELLPGNHKITFAYTSLGWCLTTGVEALLDQKDCNVAGKGDPELPFSVEAGHVYDLKVSNVGENVWAWIEDTATDKVIAGSRPE